MQFANYLLYTLLITNVTLRVFTNYFQVLPKFFNITDVFITAIFLGFFILTGQKIRYFKNVLYLLLGFNIVCIIGSLLNLDYFFLPAAIAQLIMYNEPIILFLVLVNLPFNLITIKRFNKILFTLIGLQIVLGVLQVPLFILTGDNEKITGTFPGNGEQYGIVMLIGIFLFLAMSIVKPQKKWRYYVAVIISIILIILVDNKASWLGIAVSLIYMTTRLLGSKRGMRYRLSILTIGTMLLGIAFGVAKESKTFYKIENTFKVISDGKLFEIGKISAYKDVFQAFNEHPQMALFGSGLGNFFSRASRQFYHYERYLDRTKIQRRFLNKEQILKEKAERLKRKQSNSMGGVIEFTHRDPFYANYYEGYKEFYFIGSGQVDSPFSTYNALLGETGFFGIFLYLLIYYLIIKSVNFKLKLFREDRIIYPMGIAALGGIIYLLTVSVYGMWIDSGRMNTILWAITALIFRYSIIYNKKILKKQFWEHKINQSCQLTIEGKTS